jgi:two-component system LytT family response regulator
MKTAIIIEDSRLARNELKTLLKKIGGIELVAECEEADSGIEKISALKPDLIFLDIQMPGKNGFELLDELEWKPNVIFTTAYDHYAVRSFEYDAIDYLLKPIEPERLQQAINRIPTSTEQAEENVTKLQLDSSVFVKDGEQCWMVELTNVAYFSSMGNYTYVHFDGVNPLIHKSLNQLEKRLPEDVFFRANRQQIVNVKHIKNVTLAANGNLELYLGAVVIEVSRRHTNRFKQLMSF